MKKSETGFRVHADNWNILVDEHVEHQFVSIVKVEDLQDEY
jgi:hypothetical protein